MLQEPPSAGDCLRRGRETCAERMFATSIEKHGTARKRRLKPNCRSIVLRRGQEACAERVAGEHIVVWFKGFALHYPQFAPLLAG